MRKSTLFTEGSFYKGNIHCHSTRSDGRLTPAQQVEAYKQHGYDFLLLTEHNVFTDTREFDTPDFLLLPGMEITFPGCKAGCKGVSLPGDPRHPCTACQCQAAPLPA
jgi:hypothetical protein